MIGIKRLFLCCLFFSVFTLTMFAQTVQTSGEDAKNLDSGELRKQAFEQVWASVSAFCFDENVCGKKWDAVKQNYEPRVLAAKSDNEFHMLLQMMLNELKTSHFHIIPISVSGDVVQPQPWGIGADVEIIGNQLTIKKTFPDSPAEKTGLRPGFVITAVNDKPIAQMIRDYGSNPLWAGKNWRKTFKDLIQTYYLNGTQNSEAAIEFLDGKDAVHKTVVQRSVSNQTPSIFEHKMMEGGIGYLKLNSFIATAMPEFCKTIHAMNDSPAIILDLRDNPGGLIGMTASIMGLLESKPVKFGRLFRDMPSVSFMSEDVPVESYPQAKPYAGRVVVLINGSSASSSEILSSGLQENGRAVIVGEQSAGEVMSSIVYKLPTPAFFQIAISDFETANGVRLEGKGVTPDIKVSNGRKALLENADYQLQAAIDLIKSGKGFDVIKPEKKQVSTIVKTKKEDDTSRFALAGIDKQEIENIFDKYISVVGGKEALEKLHSRKITGIVTSTENGAKVGEFVLYEKTPDKYLITLYNEDGTVQQESFNGADYWTFNSLLGFKKSASKDVSRIGRIFDPDLGLSSAPDLKGKYAQGLLDKEQEKDAFIIYVDDENSGHTERLLFDKQTAFLLKKGSFEYGDYRLIDGIQIPFSVKASGLTFTVSEVKHNIDIADEIFANPVPNCFLMTDKISQ